MELGSIIGGRPGPARHSRTSTDQARRAGCRAGSVTEGRPALWSLAWVERARPFSGSQQGRCGHGRSLVPSRGGAGTAVLWFPTRAVRARSFSGSQQGRCGHGRSLVPSRGGVGTAVVPSRGGAGTAVLWFPTRAEEKSVAWRRSVALLQAREEEEDRGEKRREERS